MQMEEINYPATPTLLCLENIDMSIDDLQINSPDGSPFLVWDHKKLNFNNLYLIKDNHGSEPFLGFLIQSDENFGFMIEREKEYLPQEDYMKKLHTGDLELGNRSKTLDLIWKAHAYHDLGPYSFCLSANYLDRFLSAHELQVKENKWAVELLAIACVSIASKVEGNKFPKFADLLVGEPTFEFDAEAYQRMELMMLRKLKWKMHASTPCSFIDYFLRKLNCEKHVAESSILRSIGVILDITKCVDFLEFKPSEIAAAVAISVSRELQAKDVNEALTCFPIVAKERVLKCLELMSDLSLIKVSDDLGNNMEPFVLDGGCLSNELLTFYSSEDSPHDSPNPKRFKTDGSSYGTHSS